MTYDWTVLDRMQNKNGDKLLPFQKEGIRQLVVRKHNLLADEMGLGKSVQAIGLMEVARLRKILIVTKATLKTGFARHMDNWALTKRVIQIIDKKTDFVSDLAEVVIVNYDLVNHSFIHQQLIEVQWDLIVCDEAHRLKNMEAKRTQAVLAKNGLVRYATRTLMMTGTPVLNRPVELYPILKVLAPTVIAPYSDYHRYTKRYCDAWQDGFGWNAKGASNTSELNLKLREHYMIRRLTHEVEVQLPKRRFEMVFVDSTPGVKANLRILDEAGRKDFKYQNIEAGAGQLATIRRETAEEKIEATIGLIKEYVESTGKIVLFAYHHSIIERLERELKEYGTVSVSGSTSGPNRDRAIQSFRVQEKIKVFIGQIQSAGEGVDGLQDICNNALFLEWSYVPGEIEQAIKRLHRIGQNKPCLFRFLVWADSVEEHMMRIALDKVKVIKEILK